MCCAAAWQLPSHGKPPHRHNPPRKSCTRQFPLLRPGAASHHVQVSTGAFGVSAARGRTSPAFRGLPFAVALQAAGVAPASILPAPLLPTPQVHGARAQQQGCPDRQSQLPSREPPRARSPTAAHPTPRARCSCCDHCRLHRLRGGHDECPPPPPPCLSPAPQSPSSVRRKTEGPKESNERDSTLGTESGRQKRARGHRKPRACRARPGRPSPPVSTVAGGGAEITSGSRESVGGSGSPRKHFSFLFAPLLFRRFTSGVPSQLVLSPLPSGEKGR
ncbi:hypothetical protein P7K49_031136 [Saguinus oedipus]|uniref:Uncharacterized protein n=1 Tax=Saguinus oedipus TaxID=9490 RepID=A0ABQ9U670_SAGOE|nr:hypothetical protein P7K49_031136 [Saguinus oedipus]